MNKNDFVRYKIISDNNNKYVFIERIIDIIGDEDIIITERQRIVLEKNIIDSSKIIFDLLRPGDALKINVIRIGGIKETLYYFVKENKNNIVFLQNGFWEKIYIKDEYLYFKNKDARIGVKISKIELCSNENIPWQT